MNVVTRPLPSSDGLTGQFYRHLAQGELRLQRCKACNTFRHIPRVLCPSCHGDEWEWIVASGLGEVFSWTTTMRAMHPAFADVPLIIATVALQEGPRLLARLIGVPPEAVKIGLPVQVDFLPVGENVAIAQFRPRNK